MRKPLFPPSLPEGRRLDAIGLGANAADQLLVVPHHPAPGEKVRFGGYRRAGGGQAATAMVTVARLGYRAGYLGGVGDDPEGEAQLRDLAAEGVEVGGVRRRAGRMTQRAFILVDEASGERTILWGRDQAMLLKPEEIRAEEVVCARLLHVDGQNPWASARAARIAREAGMPVLADLEEPRPGTEQLLPEVDFLIVAEEFPERLSGSRDARMGLLQLAERARGALAIVTRGPRGALAWIEGEAVEFPAYAIEARDTTGAGDVFHGAFAVACLRGLALGDAVDFAHAVAAMSCLELGGRAGLPRSAAEVERFRRATPHRIAGAL